MKNYEITIAAKAIDEKDILDFLDELFHCSFERVELESVLQIKEVEE